MANVFIHEEIENLAQDVVNSLISKNLKVSIAESCTGGMVCAAITSVPGASRVLESGLVTYANKAKIKYTDVTQKVLNAWGAVSEQTALLMASGIVKNTGTIGMGITGIAGPDGGIPERENRPEKPVGTVYIAVAQKSGVSFCEHHVFTGNRQQIREKTTKRALEILHDFNI
jgi:PncC family amidohydrolase